MQSSPSKSVESAQYEAILYRTEAFSYVYSTDEEIKYITQSGQKTLGFLPSEPLRLSELFSSRKSAVQLEQATQQYMNNVQVFSAQLIDSQKSTRDVTLYEKAISIKRNNEEINGVQGICIFKDESITFEEEMVYIRVIFKSRLSYCLASPIQMPYIDVKSASNTIVKIFEEMLQFRKKEDLWPTIGRAKFFNGVKFFVERSLPVEFILPAFPFKSLNTEYKVLGKLPDKGEELAMQTLMGLCLAIERVYAPGANVNIVSDGTIFSDIDSIPEENVVEYKEKLKKIIPGMEKYIQFNDLGCFFDYCDELMVKREELLRFSGRSFKFIENKIKTNEDTLRMYTAFRRLAEHEHFQYSAIKESGERSPLKPTNVTGGYIKRFVKEKAKISMVRNEAYSRLIEEIIPLYVRFTIHLYDNSGPKFSIKLMNLAESDDEIGVADNHIPTPWHNVIVETKDGKFVAMRRYEAKKLVDESHLVYYEPGWPSHYKL